MKTNVLIAGMIVVLAAIGAAAQPNDSTVGILPGAEPGLLKVIYAGGSQDMVLVRFINNDGLLITDRIRAEKFSHGFHKSYDVSRIQADRFWIEVSAGNRTVRYKLELNDKGKLVPSLEQRDHGRTLVAAIN
jgi:hypothetical protein